MLDRVLDQREQARRLDRGDARLRAARTGCEGVLPQAVALLEQEQPLGDRTVRWELREETVLLRDVFSRAKYSDYRRAVCLLDPYNINLTWDVIEAAGQWVIQAI